MIAVETRGRLGNQMFQFAFGMAASRRLNTDFVIADDLLRSLFELGPYGGIGRRGWRALRYRLGARFAPVPIVSVPNSSYDDPADVMRKLSDETAYSGFFQSEDFFIDVAPDVRDAFAPRSKHEQRFEAVYAGLLERPYVCCHVRRGDYVPSGLALPMSYYRDALELLGSSSDVPIVFVGDDLAPARAEFGEGNVRFEQNTEILDLLLLARAHAVVVSNSSFAWWGAWLNRSANAQVIAPRYWLGVRDGHESPPKVIPASWRQLDVRIES